jgi:hypothetical protein
MTPEPEPGTGRNPVAAADGDQVPPLKGGPAQPVPLAEDDLWMILEWLGRSTGHMVARCPGCGARQMIAYRPPSQPNPRCRICLGTGWERRSASWGSPRLVVISDRSLVTNKRPGEARNATELRRVGLKLARPLPQEVTEAGAGDDGSSLPPPEPQGAS